MTKTVGLIFVIFVSSVVYFSTQVFTVYGGDAGDFLSSIAVLGIPHPPGYPFYTALGVLLSKFAPFGTLAYKMAFLSSIPSVFTLTFLYLVLHKLTGKILIAVISVFTLGFSYTFWLYSVVVEIFSLNNLFTVSLIYLSFLFNLNRKVKYIYALSFILGLALTNHQIIIFLLPSLIFLIYSKLKRLSKKGVLLAFFYFLAGLTPYIYVIIASFNNPAINWMGSFSVTNFLRLIFRSTYGTFTAGRFISNLTFSRFINVFGFFEHLFDSFSPVVVILAIGGLVYLYKINKRFFQFLLIAFLSYLFFLFYASFPLSDNFMLATFERFMLPLYLLLTIAVCFGLWSCQNIIGSFYKRVIKNGNREILVRITILIFAFIPLLLFIINYGKIASLRKDFTAENLALDILSSVENNSILILSSDTPLFNTQYIYYSQKKWPNIKLLHFSKLYLPFYAEKIPVFYPEIKISQAIKSSADFEQFLKQNMALPIYAKQPFELVSGNWIPLGLVYKYIPENSVYDTRMIIEQNEILWSRYHDPLSGSLPEYNNLFLTEIAKLYLTAHQETALFEAKNGHLSLAVGHLTEAKKIDIHDQDNYILLSQIYIKRKECDRAGMEIGKLEKMIPFNNLVNYLKYLNFQACYGNAEEAKAALDLYFGQEKAKEQPLKKL